MYSKFESSISAKIRLFHGATTGNIYEVKLACRQGANINAHLSQDEKKQYAQIYDVSYVAQEDPRLDYIMNAGLYVFDDRIKPLQLCLFSQPQVEGFINPESKMMLNEKYYQIANFLLDAGALPSETTGHGLTTIYSLLMKGFTNDQCMNLLKRLIEKGAPTAEVSVGGGEAGGVTPTNLACWALINGYREAFALLLNHCKPSHKCSADGLRAFILDGVGLERDTLDLSRLIERFRFVVGFNQEKKLLDNILSRALNRDFISSLVMKYKTENSDLELASTVRKIMSHSSVNLLEVVAARGILPGSLWAHLSDDGFILKNTGPIIRALLRQPDRYVSDDDAFQTLKDLHSSMRSVLFK